MAVRERIYLTKSELEVREMAILNDRHIERYGMIRQWCWGRVLDFGCGCGYGSYMISRNPDVEWVYGLDKDGSSIHYATREFGEAAKLVFGYDLKRDTTVLFEGFPIRTDYSFDTLVALEIMEHIEDEYHIPNLAKEVQAKTVIISYPSKKTTHYNKHHYHDFTKEDMHRLWEKDNDFVIREFIELYREHMIVRIERI